MNQYDVQQSAGVARTNRLPNGQIAFRRGHPILFIAVRPFTLGQGGMPVRVGTEIQFDGTEAEIDGDVHKIPFLRGAAKAGWMVPADEYVEDNPEYQRRTRAQIQVRPVNGGNPLNPQPRSHIVTTESDEREVGNTREHANRTAAGNRDYVRGRTAINVVQPGSVVKTQRGMMEVEVQDGVELDRELMTPAGERSKERLDLTSEKAARAMKVAQSAQIRPGEGITEEDMLDRMDPLAREEYLLKKEALRSQYVVDEGPTEALPRPPARRVVARVQTKTQGQHEGMQFRNHVGGGTAVGDEYDGEVVGTVKQAKDVVETFEEGGIKFTTTNGPSRRQQPRRPAEREPQYEEEAPSKLTASADRPPPVPGNLDVRRKIAKAVCPDFPESYDFTLSPKKKLARLEADFEHRHDVLRAVYAAESDDMKALLIQEFPKAFEDDQS